MKGRWVSLAAVAGMLSGCAHVAQEVSVIQQERHDRALCSALFPSSSSAPLSFEVQGRWQAESLRLPYAKNQGYFEASYEAQTQYLRILLTSAWGMPIAEMTYSAEASFLIKLASGERLNEKQWSEYTQQQMGIAFVLPLTDLVGWLQPDFPDKARLANVASSLSSDTIDPLNFSGTLNHWKLSWFGHYHESLQNGPLCGKFFPRTLDLQPLQANYRIKLEIDQKESVWK
jgi:hypothetical protein